MRIGLCGPSPLREVSSCLNHGTLSSTFACYDQCGPSPLCEVSSRRRSRFVKPINMQLHSNVRAKPQLGGASVTWIRSLLRFDDAAQDYPLQFLFDEQTRCGPIPLGEVRPSYFLFAPTRVRILVRQKPPDASLSEPPCGLDPQSGASSRLMETDFFRLMFALFVSRFTFCGCVAVR